MANHDLIGFLGDDAGAQRRSLAHAVHKAGASTRELLAAGAAGDPARPPTDFELRELVALLSAHPVASNHVLFALHEAIKGSDIRTVARAIALMEGLIVRLGVAFARHVNAELCASLCRLLQKENLDSWIAQGLSAVAALIDTSDGVAPPLPASRVSPPMRGVHRAVLRLLQLTAELFAGREREVAPLLAAHRRLLKAGHIFPPAAQQQHPDSLTPDQLDLLRRSAATLRAVGITEQQSARCQEVCMRLQPRLAASIDALAQQVDRLAISRAPPAGLQRTPSTALGGIVSIVAVARDNLLGSSGLGASQGPPAHAQEQPEDPHAEEERRLRAQVKELVSLNEFVCTTLRARRSSSAGWDVIPDSSGNPQPQASGSRRSSRSHTMPAAALASAAAAAAAQERPPPPPPAPSSGADEKPQAPRDPPTTSVPESAPQPQPEAPASLPTEASQTDAAPAPVTEASAAPVDAGSNAPSQQQQQHVEAAPVAAEQPTAALPPAIPSGAAGEAPAE